MAWYYLEYSRHIAQYRLGRWTDAPAIHSASNVKNEKRVEWAFNSMHAYDPVSIVMVLPLELLYTPSAA